MAQDRRALKLGLAPLEAGAKRRMARALFLDLREEGKAGEENENTPLPDTARPTR